MQKVITVVLFRAIVCWYEMIERVVRAVSEIVVYLKKLTSKRLHVEVTTHISHGYLATK